MYKNSIWFMRIHQWNHFSTKICRGRCDKRSHAFIWRNIMVVGFFSLSHSPKDGKLTLFFQRYRTGTFVLSWINIPQWIFFLNLFISLIWSCILRWSSVVNDKIQCLEYLKCLDNCNSSHMNSHKLYYGSLLHLIIFKDGMPHAKCSSKWDLFTCIYIPEITC